MIELLTSIATNLGAFALGAICGRVAIKVARHVRRSHQSQFRRVLPVSRFEGHEQFDVPIRCAIRIIPGNRRMNALEQLNVRE